MNALARFNTLATQPRFQGWPLVGTPELENKIPFFGQTLKYQLETGNGVEDYVSIIRHFGWCVVFGVTTDLEVLTLVQWKPGVNCASWELPPGDIGQTPPDIAMDDLLLRTRAVYFKETGYGGGDWQYPGATDVESGKYRGTGPDDHGLPAHMFLATGPEERDDARSPNPNEIMETPMVTLEEFWPVIDSGQFREVSALPCAMLALRRLGVRG